MSVNIARRNARRNTDPEKKVEKRLVDRIMTDLGGIAWKFTSPGTRGVPDRIIVLNGLICFVELKRPEGGRLTDEQQWRIKQLQNQGMKAYVIRNTEQVDALVNSMMRGVLPHEI